MVANKFLCDFFPPPRSCSPLNLSPTGSPGRKRPYPCARGPQLLSTQPHIPVASRTGPPGAGATGRAAGPRGLDRLLSLCAPFVCSEVISHPGTRTHCRAISHLLAQASSLCPRQMGPSFFALGGGLAKVSKMRVWNASGKEMRLHTGPASMAVNAFWEVAQDLRPGVWGGLRCAGEGPAELPNRGEMGWGKACFPWRRGSCPWNLSVPLEVE